MSFHLDRGLYENQERIKQFWFRECQGAKESIVHRVNDQEEEICGVREKIRIAGNVDFLEVINKHILNVHSTRFSSANLRFNNINKITISTNDKNFVFESDG